MYHSFNFSSWTPHPRDRGKVMIGCGDVLRHLIRICVAPDIKVRHIAGISQ